MIERQGNDGGKVWYQHVGERDETKQVSSNSGLATILRGRFEGQDRRQTSILMFTHSVDWEKLCSVGNKPRYFDAQILLGY